MGVNPENSELTTTENSAMGELFAQVYLMDSPYQIDRPYTYRVPPDLAGQVCSGRFVMVPFGSGDRHKIALVTEVSQGSREQLRCVGNTPFRRLVRIKSIVSVLSDAVVLSQELTSLSLWMKERTLCTVGDAVRAMVPAFALSQITDCYRLSAPSQPAESLSPDADAPLSAERVLDAVGRLTEMSRSAAGISADRIADALGTQVSSVSPLLSRLVREGSLIRTPVLTGEHEGVKTRIYRAAPTVSVQQYARLAAGETVEGIRLRSPIHRAVAAFFSEHSPKDFCGDAPHRTGEEFAEPELSRLTGAGTEQFRAMVEKGLLSVRSEVRYRDPVLREEGERKPFCPNEEQAAALETLTSLADEDRANAALLFGVTGSGKTLVMTGLLDHVLDAGGGAILLLPEISLTPQTLAIFCSRYGRRVAVIHSGLSAGERYDAYRRIRTGEATLVVGTRSAVFAPVANLRLIIMDEEQEHTYKSDRNPKYHARDVARFRCAANRALLLLASATPSIESYKKAMDGTYRLIRMTKRYGGAKLPEVHIADMRREPVSNSVTPLGRDLLGELLRVHRRGEQSLLFLNRRGFHRYLSCRDCGKPLVCPNCSVSMTYHTEEGNFEKGYLVCHLCGTRRQVPDACPSCGSLHLGRIGYGTQRVEKDLGDLLPGASVLRMDTDTTSTKAAYDRLLGAFRRHEADILLGTQMITKGHDFPDVTLVGVLNADSALFVDDYRAAERTFAMLTQVIGRAGRADKPGLAVIQTENPDADVIRLAVAQDYESFYQGEIRLREQLAFPPFCDLVLMTVTAANEQAVFSAAVELRRKLDEYLGEKGEFADVRQITFGPFEAPVFRAEGRYRMRLVVKCVLNRRSRELFSRILAENSSPPGTRPNLRAGASEGYSLSIDFNPSSL